MLSFDQLFIFQNDEAICRLNVNGLARILDWYKLSECCDLNDSSFGSVLNISCHSGTFFSLLPPHSVLVPPETSPIKKLITNSGPVYISVLQTEC